MAITRFFKACYPNKESREEVESSDVVLKKFSTEGLLIRKFDQLSEELPLLKSNTIALTKRNINTSEQLRELYSPSDKNLTPPKLTDFKFRPSTLVGSSRVDLQACKLEYSIVSPK